MFPKAAYPEKCMGCGCLKTHCFCNCEDCTKNEAHTIQFPGGEVTIAKPVRENALVNAKEWIKLAQDSEDLVYIASALDRAMAALELIDV